MFDKNKMKTFIVVCLTTSNDLEGINIKYNQVPVETEYLNHAEVRRLFKERLNKFTSIMSWVELQVFNHFQNDIYDLETTLCKSELHFT